MSVIQWGIIGCGDVTEGKSGPAFNRVPGSRLISVMRRDAEKARDYARRHHVPKWTTDADELIHDPEVTAIYIATPPDTHAYYTFKVAEAGKAVYVEKPMARTHAECQQMIAACRQRNVPLFVAYYRRCLPNFIKVREIVAAGRIGDVRFVSVRLVRPLPRDLDAGNLPWRVQPEIAGGGYFVDLASHQFDFLDYVFGPIVSTSGVAKNQAHLYPAEDIVAATFEFASGVVGSGVWCFTASEQSRIDEVRIVGSAGEVSFSTFEHSTPIRLNTSGGIEEFRTAVPQHIQQPLIASVVAELTGTGKCPGTGESAARTTWVMEEILRCAASSRRG